MLSFSVGFTNVNNVKKKTIANNYLPFGYLFSLVRISTLSVSYVLHINVRMWNIWICLNNICESEKERYLGYYLQKENASL